jgi:NAD(P)-dependent dehydrogenase (short-subunit alcohol dehydrogenase family)/predicted esterase
VAVSTLAGKKCFITGAASGIGQATARAAADRGAAVFLTDIDDEGLERTVLAIRGRGGQVPLHAGADVSDLEAVRALGRRIHEAHGPMDVVMNIAGVSVWGTVDVLEHRHWQRAIDVNLMGPIHVLETFVPEMVRWGRGGHVVNVSSAAGLLGLPWHAAYSASKFGLRGISEVLRFDLARHGIGVSLVCPGAVDTGLVRTIDIPGVDMNHADVQRLKARFLNRAISADEAAKAILRAVECNRYLVFTSLDIRAAYWLQRFVPTIYERIMHRLNDMLHRVASRAKIESFRSSPVVGLALLMLATFAMACGGGSEAAETIQTGTSEALDTGSSDTAGDESGSTTTDMDEPGASTDTDDGGSETTDTNGGGSGNLDRFVCPGAGALAEGMNDIEVGDRTRSFYLEFPDDMIGPIGVVFSWHGYNDPGSDGDAAGWRSAAEVDANADPEFPVVVVTPFDVDFDPPIGLDWQLDEGTAESNIDLAFFEAMLGCLNEQYELDPAHIHSYGFSAGSVMSSLIHSAYPDVVSAVVCVSGMWFNDPVQVEMINLIPVNPSWPVLDPSDFGTVLLTHGGPNDVTVLNIANLENMAQAAFPFLAAAERVVIDCAHDNGHTLHPELTTEQVMKFFADHPAGEPSPYIDGGLSGYPASCTLRLP